MLKIPETRMLENNMSSPEQLDPRLEQQIQQTVEKLNAVAAETSKIIVGQDHTVTRLLMAMIAQGHVLLEGMPGLAKTTVIKTVAKVLGLEFKRIQFTPDLLPSDVVGTQIYNPKTGEFHAKRGPIFANLVLADEINRAPAKVQSALLESMEERQVTVGDQTWMLEEPFLVMATQNPIEQEGTYVLPEAQVDRFMFKLNVGYGTPEQEEEVVKRQNLGLKAELKQQLTREEICAMKELVSQIWVADKVRSYIVSLVFTSREPGKRGIKELEPYIEYGGSPRASILLEKAARVQAMTDGRSFVTPQDVKDVALDILRHRIKPTYEAEAENMTSDQIVQQILERVDVP